MAAWEGVTPANSFARTPLANQTIANRAPHRAREVPSSAGAAGCTESTPAAAWRIASMLRWCKRTTSTPRRRIDDGDLGRRYPGEQVRANLANQTFANPAPSRAPERSTRSPARARMAVSDRLCWRPIQARAISQTAFDRLARARARGANQRVFLIDRRGVIRHVQEADRRCAPRRLSRNRLRSC
jgi:hypothetical protein